MKRVMFLIFLMWLLGANLISAQEEEKLKVGIFTPEFPPKQNLISWEKELNGEFEIVAWYQHWGKEGSSNKLQYVCQMGKTPLITWEPWLGHNAEEGNPFPLWDIASGKFDDLIIKQLEGISQTAKQNGCKEVWVRFAHEMNTPEGQVYWYPWQGYPTDYVFAWRHVVELGRQQKVTFKWLWAPAWGNEDAQKYYPGDGYVDSVGTTINQYWRDKWDLRVDKWIWHDWSHFYNQDKEILEGFGKPIIIAETATGEGPEEESKAAWINNMFATAEANPQILAVVWFNDYHAREFEDVNFRIDSSPKSFQAFKQNLSQK